MCLRKHNLLQNWTSKFYSCFSITNLVTFLVRVYGKNENWKKKIIFTEFLVSINVESKVWFISITIEKVLCIDIKGVSVVCFACCLV